MANIKSAEKRNRQRIKAEAANRIMRGSARTAIKKARQAIAAGDPHAVELVRAAESALDRAATKGVLHANTASRKVSRLAQRVKALSA